MLFGNRNKDTDPRERALWADLMSLGMVFPIAIALGFYIGRWLGGLLGHPKIGMAVGLVWGIATGFWELYKVTVRLEQQDAAKGDPPKAPDRKRGGGGDASGR